MVPEDEMTDTEIVQRLVRERPDVTSTFIVEAINLHPDVGEALRHIVGVVSDNTTCRRCGKPIHRLGSGGQWRHADSSRGCRSASFLRGDAEYPDGSSWDNSIPVAWKALPPLGWVDD